MTVKIGKHELYVKKSPDIFIDEVKGIMSIILTVEDKDGERYELHYISSMDDPDLIISDTFFEELAELWNSAIYIFKMIWYNKNRNKK